MWQKLQRDCAAVTSVEYGLIAALLALGILACIDTIGSRITDVFAVLASQVGGAPPGNSGNGP